MIAGTSMSKKHPPHSRPENRIRYKCSIMHDVKRLVHVCSIELTHKREHTAVECKQSTDSSLLYLSSLFSSDRRYEVQFILLITFLLTKYF